MEVLKGLGNYFRPGFLLALPLIAVACYLWATTGQIPDTLAVVITSIIAFYFGEGAGRILAQNGKKNGP